MSENSSVNRSRRDVLRIAAASAVGLALPGGLSASADAPVGPGGASGPLRSAGVLTFGPDNVGLKQYRHVVFIPTANGTTQASTNTTTTQ
jgi:hypothetical protein